MPIQCATKRFRQCAGRVAAARARIWRRAPRTACRSCACRDSTRTVADFEALAPAWRKPATAGGSCDRFARARPIRIRPQSRKTTTCWSSSATSCRYSDRARRRPAVFVGSSRGGHSHDAPRRGAPDRDRRRRAARHRAGDRAEGTSRASKAMSASCRSREILPKGRRFCVGCSSGQFPNLTAEQWLAAAQRTWQMDDGEPRAHLRCEIGPHACRYRHRDGRCRRCGTNSTRWRACRCWSSAAAIRTFFRRQR